MMQRRLYFCNFYLLVDLVAVFGLPVDAAISDDECLGADTGREAWGLGLVTGKVGTGILLEFTSTKLSSILSSSEFLPFHIP